MPTSPAVLSKRYAGRRLHHTGIIADPTLDGLARMVEDDGDFAVRILQDITRKRALHG